MVTVDDVREAADRIAGRIVRTPLLSAPWVDDAEVWLKPESLQPTGAFKLRGATNAVACLAPDQGGAGVVTHSSGNHGWALAHAARAAGVRATVVVPEGCTPLKVDAIASAGAEVVIVPVEERVERCTAIARSTGAVVVPPFDHADVIAGQGTVGLEVVADLPDVETVLVPVGGGGLISGVAVAVKALAPRARVVGCEPELAGDAAASVRAGRLVEWSAGDTSRTMADGLRVPALGELCWDLIHDLVDDIVTVREDAISAAVLDLISHSRLVVEPSGAVPLAALREHPAIGKGRTVVVVSGGNIDPSLLRRLLAGAR